MQTRLSSLNPATWIMQMKGKVENIMKLNYNINLILKNKTKK
jgi:hypothetical protein